MVLTDISYSALKAYQRQHRDHFPENLSRSQSIKNEQEYAAAVEEIEKLLEAEPGKPEGDKFDTLAKMIQEYDDIDHKLS